MAWSAVYDSVTGRLISVGQVVASPLPSTMSAEALAGFPDPSQMWDEVARVFVARPAPVVGDRVADFMAQPEITSQTVANRTKIQTAAIRIIGADALRYY